MAATAVDRRPFIEHLHELRARLFYSSGAVLVGAIVGYLLHERILRWLQAPLQQTLFYTSPAGGFDFLVKISVLFGILLAVPVVLYNLLRFLVPAMSKHSRNFIALVLIASLTLLVLGVSFAYTISLPAALNFLASFESQQVQSLISTTEYLNFVMIYVAGFGILFQLPLLLLTFNHINPLDPGQLVRKSGLVALISFVVAAIITPTPDPFNQAIMALPVILLYEFSVLLIWIVNHSRKQIKQLDDELDPAWFDAQAPDENNDASLSARAPAVPPVVDLAGMPAPRPHRQVADPVLDLSGFAASSAVTQPPPSPHVLDLQS